MTKRNRAIDRRKSNPERNQIRTNIQRTRQHDRKSLECPFYNKIIYASIISAMYCSICSLGTFSTNESSEKSIYSANLKYLSSVEESFYPVRHVPACGYILILEYLQSFHYHRLILRPYIPVHAFSHFEYLFHQYPA